MSSEQRDDVLPLTWAVGNEYEANWRSIWIHFKSNQIRIEETPEGILHITTRKKMLQNNPGSKYLLTTLQSTTKLNRRTLFRDSEGISCLIMFGILFATLLLLVLL